MSETSSEVITRKSEILITSSEPAELRNKFLAKRLLRTWTEDFVDNQSGEVITIERSEVIADRGVLITGDMLSQLMFYIQSGDISEITVSNQRRVAAMLERNSMFPWTATVRLGEKKKKFILYACNLQMATEIVKDYVELNYVEYFDIIQVKEFTQAILLKDTLNGFSQEDGSFEDERQLEESEDQKFYQIDVTVITDDEDVSYPAQFVVETKDIDKSLVVIRSFLDERNAEREYKITELKLEQAKIIPCDSFIEREFSMAYLSK